jgi:hypothetical protein
VEGVASLGGIVVIDFLLRRALRKKFSVSFLQEGNKTSKQAKKLVRISFSGFFLFFLQPCVSFPAALSV